MTVHALCTKVSEFCEFLAMNSVALNIQSHTVINRGDGISRITWVCPPSELGYLREIDVCFIEYMNALKVGDFSILMNDGGIIQISIDYRAREIVGHRMVYLPCPIYIEPDDVVLDNGEIYPIDDFINDLSQEEFRERLRVRAPLRFEFDPSNAGENHPASHLHLGRSDCRVPVSCPIQVETFLRFIFKHFYNDEFRSHELIRELPHRELEPATITAAERDELYIAI